MENHDYHMSFITSSSADDAYEKIMNVSGWWAKHFDGSSEKTGDVFTVRFGSDGEKDMFKIEVIEAIPGKRIAWKVIDSKQEWVSNPAEWTGTEIVWDLAASGSGTEIAMTHRGLTAQLECYGTCEGAWNYLTSESLSQLLEENVGKPA